MALGDVLDSFSSPGSDPTGLAWDGTNLWHCDANTDVIYKLDPADGSELDSFASPGSAPQGLAWDGENLWNSDRLTDTIYKLDPSDGSQLDSFSGPDWTKGLAWDGANLWNVDSANNLISKLDPSDGSVLASFSTPASNAEGLAWDGENLWLADSNTETIYKLDPSDGSELDSFSSPGSDPHGLAWDGTNLWNADRDTDTIYKLEVPPPLTVDFELRWTVEVALRFDATVQWTVVGVVSFDAAVQWDSVGDLVVDATIQWTSGGHFTVDHTLQWTVAGSVEFERHVQWQIEPSQNRVRWALEGRFGAVVYGFRFEKRDVRNNHITDVSNAIHSASLDLNNDRAILRTAQFQINPEAADIDPLTDNIAIFCDLLVDGSYTKSIEMGLFRLDFPSKQFTPGQTMWDVSASDMCILLQQATTTESYTIDEGENYITGDGAVRDILDDVGVRRTLPATSKTLPADMTWESGTPWLTVINDLLDGVNMYRLWFDARGRARTREREDLDKKSVACSYACSTFVLSPVNESAETTRFANQIIAVSSDPNQEELRSVKTNSDPDSTISTVTLGRTISKTVERDAVADQETLDQIAEQELQLAASLHWRAEIDTFFDPRREAHEAYELDVEDIYDGVRWDVRNWSTSLEIGVPMQHSLGRVEKVTAS